MTKKEYLLICLAEECAEVIKEVNKALRFGLDDSHPKYPGTNQERIEAELTDLGEVLKALDREGIKFKRGSFHKTMEKSIKLKKYMDYSIEKGIVS